MSPSSSIQQQDDENDCNFGVPQVDFDLEEEFLNQRSPKNKLLEEDMDDDVRGLKILIKKT